MNIKIQNFLNRIKTPKHKWLLSFLIIPVVLLFTVWHDHPQLQVIGTSILILIAFIVNAFVFTYARRNWRANPYGRALMYAEASFASLADLTLVTAILGPNWEFRFEVRLVLFCILLVTQARLFQLLFSSVDTTDRDNYDDNYDKVGKEI